MPCRASCPQLHDLPEEWQREIPNRERLLQEEEENDGQLQGCHTQEE